MACYLFTFHAYGTWLPDRQRGFVRRDGQGIHEQDFELGQTYRQQMTQDIVRFDHLLQQRMIQTLLESTGKQHFRLHGVATDQSHLHILISWTNDRTWEQMRYALKRSLSLALNQIQKQTWFTRSGSRKRVKDQEHFDYLMQQYLRNHKGAQWFEK
jgi:crotonobetainyl-CoA:carnitine CoA-transferase CaiB-like acyl-CoA transferase